MPHSYDIVEKIVLHKEICQVVRARAYKAADTKAAYIVLLATDGRPMNSILYDFPVWHPDWKEEHNYLPSNHGTARTIEVAVAANVLEKLSHENRDKSELSIVAVKIDNIWTPPLPYKVAPFLTVPE